jgi:hypothetical protein
MGMAAIPMFAHGAAKKIFRPSFAPHPRALRGFCLSLTQTAKNKRHRPIESSRASRI